MRTALVDGAIEVKCAPGSGMRGRTTTLVGRSRGKATRVQIKTINKDIKKTHRVCGISIVLEDFRKKHDLIAITPVDRAHISSKEQ
jgi:hypothetical protein